MCGLFLFRIYLLRVGLNDLVLVSVLDEEFGSWDNFLPIRDDRGTIVGVAVDDGTVLETLYYSSSE